MRHATSRRDFVRLLAGAVGILAAAGLAGCVDQHPNGASPLTAEGAAGARGGETGARLVAVSRTVVEACDRLGLTLVGVTHADEASLPMHYRELPDLGTAGEPDLDRLRALRPDYVLLPSSLEDDLRPSLARAGIAALVLNDSSVDGLVTSTRDVGYKFGRQVLADRVVSEYRTFMRGYRRQSAGRQARSALVLAGLPTSFVVATSRSYVGSLVALAGGGNVGDSLAADPEASEVTSAFVEPPAGGPLGLDPDVVLCASLDGSDATTSMFERELSGDTPWAGLRAVQEGSVYDLAFEQFGTSAAFNYGDALATLRPILYGEVDG